MKIFISIASYQDPLLETTILSAFNNAIAPENLHFGICDQSSKPLDISLFSFASQISYEHIDTKTSEGPCCAIHIIKNFYENEYYYFQIAYENQFESNSPHFHRSFVFYVLPNKGPQKSLDLYVLSLIHI
mgnify:CR=1 FL=1